MGYNGGESGEEHDDR
jgi:hypothetical protein